MFSSNHHKFRTCSCEVSLGTAQHFDNRQGCSFDKLRGSLHHHGHRSVGGCSPQLYRSTRLLDTVVSSVSSTNGASNCTCTCGGIGRAVGVECENHGRPRSIPVSPRLWHSAVLPCVRVCLHGAIQGESAYRSTQNRARRLETAGGSRFVWQFVEPPCCWGPIVRWGQRTISPTFPTCFVQCTTFVMQHRLRCNLRTPRTANVSGNANANASTPSLRPGLRQMEQN